MARGEIHVIVLPFPVQGHTNPMVQFSKQLVARGLRVTLATTVAFSSKFTQFQSSSITVETISDGIDEVTDPSKNIDEYVKSFDHAGPQSLAQLISEKIERGHLVKCLVYDSIIPWGLDVARNFGIDGASFFTQSCLVNLIFYQVYKGMLVAPFEKSLDMRIPGIPPSIKAKDLPSFVSSMGLYPSIERITYNQYSNCGYADWRFFSTFEALESELLNWMSSQWPIKTIGPTIPSMYLDKRLTNDKDYGLSLFKPETSACIEWLDAKVTGSVVYISMGSLATVGVEQMEEMAKGLEKSNKFFLWVVRASEEDKLPLNFKENVSGKGLIVNWCPQLEVLAHRALGCFMTHCGWNSTLEAISLGVPMVAFPQWSDQPTNAKCIADLWRIGVRVQVNEKGVATGEEIESCIREVMEGERAKEIRNNANKWKQLAIEAMQEGGSSNRNIEEFIAKLSSS